MLLQTNSYVVPRDRKAEHARLVRRFRQTFARLGCDTFEVYEQVGSNWSAGESSGRFVQIMRFRDRRHQLAVQEAERNDPDAQALIAEFCDLINFPYQRQQGLFAVGFYISVLPSAARKQPELVDKTGVVKGEEDTQSDGASAEKKPAGPAKPAALVEPGAATRGPIVTPVGPGQVPIITPAPGEEQHFEAARVPEPATAPQDEPALDPADGLADLDVAGEFEHADVAATSESVDAAESERSASDETASPDSQAANPRWQPSEDLDEQIEGDVTADLTDSDEDGQVRVADDALLQAEADFAEYSSDRAAAFDELKPKPKVIEGVVIDDDVYGNGADPAPMGEDDALAALEMTEGEAIVGPPDFEREIKEISVDDAELDDLQPLPDPSDDKKSKPPKHDEVAG